MESIEASGRSIEDAILQALARLGRRRDEVDVTVLQEPARGTRGMSAREARVRVMVKAPRRQGAAVVTPEMADAFLADADEEAQAQPRLADDDGAYAARQSEGEADEGAYDDEYYDDELEDAPEGLVAAPVVALTELLGPEATVEQVAVEALRAILAHMGLGATLIEVRGRDPLTLNVRSATGEDLSLLIGRRGDTLASLQLLVALIVSKQTGQRERIVVDAEGYRDRREENLRSLAQRVAQQVRRSQTAVTLEAMPPNERRIIHMELADDEDLSTESSGEGEQRRIVISLKRSHLR
ncbi:MAG TPA: RNA-binding cell elongation regulator Jag/EloR [Ktedonobacterales bacterium]|nr:RNA-binding cell elongation regulator Jag/EloR [Ktedonobacterales bacterium]